MWLVTFIAVSDFDRNVRSLLNPPGVRVIVAVGTHFYPAGHSQRSIPGTVGIMAIGAQTIPHRIVDIGKLQTRTHILVAGHA